MSFSASCDIPRDMRDEIESTNLLALDVYDVAFKKRQETKHMESETW